VTRAVRFPSGALQRLTQFIAFGGLGHFWQGLDELLLRVLNISQLIEKELIQLIAD
jgi:hypothetical protein